MIIMEVLWIVLAVVGAVTAATFAVMYDYKTGGSWRQYPMGRHMMGFVTIVGVCLALIAVSRIRGPLGPWVWVPAIFVLDVYLIQRVWLLVTRRFRSRLSEPSDRTIEEERRR